MPFALSRRVAVVTGGASGIGREIALQLTQHGAKVFVGDFRLRDENHGLFAQLGIVERPCDVRSEDDVRALVEGAVQQGGGLDILVNSAGVVCSGHVPDLSEAEWDACLDTNLKGAFLTCKHAIPAMRRRGGGAIVNIASNAGILPRAHDPAYSTSKAALLAFTRSLALCHAHDKIRVNAVCPGPVQDTRIINDELDRSVDPLAVARQIIDASPLCRAVGRMVLPAEIAQAVMYFVSDAALLVTGSTLAIDGGKSLGVPPKE